MRTFQYPFGGSEQAEDNGGFFFGKAGLDDQAAELDFAPGIAAALGVSYALHPSLMAPDQRPRVMEQPCGRRFCGERMRRRRATS